ncbi:lysozyme g-like [Rhinophrynus dorsalis]
MLPKALILVVFMFNACAAGRYGSIKDVPTTGASCATAKQDNLKYCGVQASHKMAQTDLGRMNKYKTIIVQAAKETGVEAAVIAGIISRESRAGNVLKNGWGDRGNAFGLMQIDKRYHKPRGAWNSKEHIVQGAKILISMYGSISKKFPSWSANQKLKGAIAAYNAGPGNIRSWAQIDSRTTGRDYSNDACARAQYFKKNGY